jgi:hypothetical protein
MRALKERQARKTSKSDSLKQWLSTILNGSKFESSRNFISWRQSDEVQVIDETKIPIEYKTEKTEVCICKNDIKKAIKAGAVVAGAELVYKNNIQIK